MLEVRNACKTYNPGTVRELSLFRNFSLTVDTGAFVSIVGSNGSGKTTLLNLICGSVPLDEGQILVDGQDVTRTREYLRSRLIGRVYQNPSAGTCGSMTILENMLEARVGSLSGGQRQALALLMSTMTPISFLILDEHTAALDPKTADIIMQLTDRIVREKHLTAMMVTHNLRYALEYGDRLMMMHQGGVVLDRQGADKQATQMQDILKIFNEISIECGN